MSEGVLLAPALVTPSGPAPRRGPEISDTLLVREAAIAWRDGLIAFAGHAADLPAAFREEVSGGHRRVSGSIVPGFVDCHTHMPFFGWRSDEFEARLAGETYRDVQGRGGGIFRSRRLLAEASDEEVLDFCVPLAEEMLAHGTTALELKTGYGLSVEAELRQARLARRLSAEIPQAATVTLLSCHAVPPEYDRHGWVEEVCGTIIPAAAAEGLIDAVDVYVEDIAFTVDDLRLVGEAAAAAGLPLRAHADQLGASGTAEVAAALGARSADHLNHCGAAGVTALGHAGATAAVLLPASTLFIGASPAPAGELIEAGAAVALASDFNPGTSPCLSMPEVIATAASLYGLTPGQSLTAGTLNAAWVLGLEEKHGSLEAGKRADFLVLDTDDPAMIPYRPGHNPVAEVWLAGERVA
jgi:imidazolonepropionase